MDNNIIKPNLDAGESAINHQLSTSLNKDIINAAIKEKEIENEGRKDERGFLGRFWGSIEHSPNNIAGLFIILVFIVGMTYTIWMLVLVCESGDEHQKILEFWGMLSPMLTLALGYLFGKSHSR